MTLLDSDFFAVKLEILEQELVAVSGTLIENGGYKMRGAVRVVDIADPANPKLHGQTIHPANVPFYGMAVKGRCLYAAGGLIGVHMLDISAMADPIQKGTCNLPGVAWCQDVFVADNFLYAADGSNGVQILDISSPFSPVILGTCDTPNGAREIIVQNGFAYVADYHGMTVVDVTNPRFPKLVTNLRLLAMGLKVQGNYCYVASSPNGMTVVDIKNPAAPVIVASVPNAPEAIYPATVRVDVKGNIAVKANASGGIEVVDITNPTSPVRISHTQVSTIYDVLIHEGWVLGAKTGTTIFTEKLP